MRVAMNCSKKNERIIALKKNICFFWWDLSFFFSLNYPPLSHSKCIYWLIMNIKLEFEKKKEIHTWIPDTCLPFYYNHIWECSHDMVLYHDPVSRRTLKFNTLFFGAINLTFWYDDCASHLKSLKTRKKKQI